MTDEVDKKEELSDEQIDNLLGVDGSEVQDPEGFDSEAYDKALLDEIDRTLAGIRRQMRICLHAGDKETTGILRQKARMLMKKRELLAKESG